MNARVIDDVITVDVGVDTAIHAANDVVFQPVELPGIAQAGGCGDSVRGRGHRRSCRLAPGPIASPYLAGCCYDVKRHFTAGDSGFVR